ncbi:lysophospholipid acyltransferase family protein [Gymnodinialimonas ceratoperidinii]|uniref:1-acyl-sn-glycerol-3-phosphate acyltransferase n=1 Tax=Gymnodinialimonas ceratoperidinii TaxID=2856823 RepID=A0A8F6Y908_9RHOB|nr:lysophospholipid acyltransferase family protein [Gymnodinialimonas ceratoperidinii]QXT38454.1 1-acyl-sn-glycerol-3-phosphate acyltransferase [Gymnodinialimonas ceratoperidinii]
MSLSVKTPAPARALGPMALLRAFRRATPLLLALAICFPLLLLLRLPERLIWGLRRPVTPYVTQGVCLLACWSLGLKRKVIGAPMRSPGAYVANHVSWLDIFVLNAGKRMYFVAKAEVSVWGGIGWLARANGTVFIRRNRAEAAKHTRLFEDRLIAGHQLLFFPEGTSTDGQQVLPFKTTLFEAFFAERLRPHLCVQPVTLYYTAPPGADPRHYGWWGETEFAPSLMQILTTPGRGQVEVIYHDPIPVAGAANRKALAKQAEDAVRAGFDAARAAG